MHRVCTLLTMKFNWNPSKSVQNVKKHGVTFEEAMTVFFDPLAKIASDPDHSDIENRMILIGYSKKQNLLFIVHIYKEDKDTIRIISARKATKKEKNDFMNVK